jgi:hypothetical protein
MNKLLYRLGTGHIISASINVALRLEIADRLLAGPASVDDLASATGTHAEALYRVMRLLASVGLFDEQRPRVFALTGDGRDLTKGSGTYRDMGLWITNPLLFRAYAEMMHAVETGDPAIKKVTGKTVFENVAADPALAAIFNNAMSSFSASVAPAAMKVYDFSGIRTLVDVAGGHGQVLTTILRAHPAMHGILFELPHVVASAEPVVAASGVGDRCRLAAGDFFTAVPSGGDAYLLKHVIHNWHDEDVVRILTNIRTALGNTPGGRVILLDSVIRPGNEPDYGKLMDVQMLVMPGGRERTAVEFEQLFGQAGFALTRIDATDAALSVIEGRPR